jgi:hypothetical protein
MIKQKPLSGTGSASVFSGLDKERAYLFRWPAGQNEVGAPVYLRKWYHTCGNFPGAPSSASINENITGFSGASRTAAAANVDAVYELTTGNGTYALVAKSGREATSPNCQMHPYLEHHQLGDQWRGA